MNVKEAIDKFAKFGTKVYKRENGKYSLWDATQKNNREDFQYTSRDLINLAKAYGTDKYINVKNEFDQKMSGPFKSIHGAKPMMNRRNRRIVKQKINVESVLDEDDGNHFF